MTIEHRPPSASLSNTGAHRALRETREQLARVFDALHEGVVVQDRDGRIVAHNLAAERILGRSGDEIDGRTSYDPRWRAVHEDGSDFPGETHPALISLKTGLPVHNVVMGVHRADGSLVWINVNTAPFENDAGEPAGVVVGFTDVSERKYQEGQLKSALANLNSTLESTADGILVVGLDGAIIQFNRRFIEMWRIPQAVLDTRSDEQALAFVLDQLADPGAFVAKVEQLMQDVLAESFDLLRFKDGRVYERYSRPQILDSEPSGRVWSFRDVSERVRAEQSLQRSNTLFRTVQATSRVGGWEWDLASDFIYWTDETYRLFETTRDEYVPRVADIGRFFDSADDPTIRALIRGTVISGQPFETEVKLRTAKGREIWVHTICSPTLEDGRTVRLTGAFQDVTERKQSERLQSALFAISNASHESSNLDDLYRRIHEIIGELMPARNFYIALLDADNDEISFPYWVDEVDPRPEPRRHSDGGGLTNWVIRHAEPLLLTPQASQDGSLPDGLRLIGTDSIDWLGVPLLVSGKAIGILAVQSYTGDVSYDQKHLELLQFVSGQIAVAVERKRAEEQLRDNEEKFRRVFDQSPSIIALLGYPGGEFVEVNDSGIQAFGFSREQIIGRSSVELNVWVNPDDRDRYLRAMLEHGNVKDYEAVLRRKNGEHFIVLFNGSIFTLGGRRYSLNSIKDITERKRSEALLQESEEQFKGAFASSALGIALVSLDGHWLKVNSSVCSITGYSEPELLSMTFQDITHPDDLESDLAHIGVLLAGKIDSYRMKKRYFRKDGNAVWVMLSVSLVRDVDGRPKHFVSQIEDISAMVEAQRSLELASRSLEQTQHLLEASQYAAQVGGWEWDIGLNTLFWTNETYRIHDLSPGEFSPSVDSAIEFYTPESVQVLTAALQLAQSEGTPYDLELEIVSARGRHVWVRTTGSVTQVHGRVIKIGGAIQDITERKHAEQWQLHYSHVLALISNETALKDVLVALALFVEQWAVTAKCCILLMAPDDAHLVLGASPSLPGYFAESVDNIEIGQNGGACGMAALNRAPVMVEDIETCEGMLPKWRELANKAGLRAVWSVPVFSSERRVVGTFAVYHVEPWAPNHTDEDLLARSAALAALAIERARHQEAQRLARTVFEANVEGVMVTSPDDRILTVNRAFENLTGYRVDEAIGNTSAKLLDSGHHGEAFWSQINEQLVQGGRWEGEVWSRRKNGEVYPIQMSIADVRDDAGIMTQRISIMSDISMQKVQAARIEQLAFYDSLTGLPNRALFLDRLENTLAAAERRGDRGAILFMDLDRFKEINDSKGHAIGDLALAETARRFLTVTRKEETLARLGGDEFVLIAEGADQRSAALIAARLLATLSEPLVLMGVAHTIGTSIGIAFYPDDGKTSEELIKHTDIAMYRAKAGGGGYRFYQAEMSTELEKHLGIAHRLGPAMEANQLQLYYQPKISLTTKKLVGAEALLRWHDPELGWISPAVFVPVAEQRGMMGPLGDWVLRESCRQLKEWQTLGFKLPGRLSINVSVQQIEDPEILGRMLEIVHAAGGVPQWLELELTESSMMSNPEHAVEIMTFLAAAGFGLSIDDFGTGYSSLSYLKRFSADEIKIDISFVRNMLSNKNDYAIVNAIIAMAQSLGMSTTAEGVELEGQAEALRGMGCQIAQGFLYSRPVAANEFAEKWLQPPIP